MPGSTDSDAQHAGRVLWPRSAHDLTDTTICPACRTALPSPVCPACGLDLRHPAAAALLEASTDAAAALGRRISLIGRIRLDAAHAREPLQAPSPLPASSPLSVPGAPAASPVAGLALPGAWPPPSASAAAAPTPSTYREPAPAAAPRPAEPGTAPPAAAGPARPKRSSVQILLLLVGVALVAVAAIFFLTVA